MPCNAETTRLLFGKRLPLCIVRSQSLVVATAAKLDCNNTISVSWICRAEIAPASLARWIEPVASDNTSTANPSRSASAAVAITQLLLM